MKPSRFLLLAVVVATLFRAPTASANAITGTTITTVMANAGTGVPQWVTITFANSGAACVATSAMLIDVSTVKGRALLSLATAAMLAHVMVDVTGTSACQTPTNSFSTEVLNTLNVHSQ